MVWRICVPRVQECLFFSFLVCCFFNKCLGFNLLCNTRTRKLCDADGPDDVMITRPPDLQPADSASVTLQCAATSAYPSVTISWTGVTCSPGAGGAGQPDVSVCHFRPAPEDDGKVVTCVASNSLFPGRLSRNATYRLQMARECLLLYVKVIPVLAGVLPGTEQSGRQT